MKIEPPQPPTPPSPAVRPTPPTPPKIDKTPFTKDSQDVQEVSNDKPQDKPQVVDEKQSAPKVNHTDDRQTAPPPTTEKNNSPPPATKKETAPPPATVPDTQSDYDRGKGVLREFKELDARDGKSTDNHPVQSETKQPVAIAPKFNHNEGHGAGFWLFTIIFIAVTAFIIVKKFLLTDKPALTKSQLFEDSSDRLKAMVDRTEAVAPKISPRAHTQADKLMAMVNKSKTVTQPVHDDKSKTFTQPVHDDKLKATVDKSKPVTPPQSSNRSPKKDDGKGKHFEIRV